MLTERRRQFALEYLVDLNATQAAIRAGYSAETAASEGYRLLRDVEVRELVDAALARRSEQLVLTADRVLTELMRLSYVDVGRAYDDQGRLKAMSDIPEDVRRCIAGVETEEEYADFRGGQDTLDDGAERPRIAIGRVVKVHFTNKVKPLELLGKHLKLFVEVIEKRTAGLSREERIKRLSEIIEEAWARRPGATAA